MPLQPLQDTDTNPFETKFGDFFQQPKYSKKIIELGASGGSEPLLFVDFEDLHKFDSDLADLVLTQPIHLHSCAEKALENTELPIFEEKKFFPRVGFFNLPKGCEYLVKNTKANCLGKLISVVGIAKMVNQSIPKLKMATWRCNRCGNIYRVPQTGNELHQPAFCECRHKDFVLVQEDSDFVDFQRFEIQDCLEQMSIIDQTNSLECQVVSKLVDYVGAGDKLKLTGVLSLYPPKKGKMTFKPFLNVGHIEILDPHSEDVIISKKEEIQIKKLSQNPDVFKLLTNSIAPSIYGYETIKEALLLQLVSGVKRQLKDRPLRGNIHVLLLGDPSVSKSMFLESVSRLVPRSIYVTGVGSSGVGLTASVESAPEGGWVLKAGALVLASGGQVFLDELDKLSEEDYPALLESMETGTFSLAKAGIVSRFKADAVVLSAANPKYSRFDPYIPIIEQVNLPPTLISRFDLFFVMRDSVDQEKDRLMANHILNLGQGEEIVEPVDSALFCKYINYAQKLTPRLSKGAKEIISNYYVGLRQQGKSESSFVASPRQLEGLRRLSEASARVRLSDTVEKKDAERAIRLLEFSLKDVLTDPSTGKVDYSLLATGTTSFVNDNTKTIFHWLKEKQDEMDLVPLNEILDEAKSLDLDAEKVGEIIKRLEKDGSIYSPKQGLWKVNS